MKTQPEFTNRHHPAEKLKPPAKPFFSCSFFRHCVTQQSSHSPTGPLSPPSRTHPPPPQLPTSSSSSSAALQKTSTLPPPPPLPQRQSQVPRGRTHESSESSSSTSSASTSQSFTVWRFPHAAFHHSMVATGMSSPSPVTLPPQGFESEVTPRPSLNTLSSPAHDAHMEMPVQPPPPPTAPLLPPPNLQELFHIAELQFASTSTTDRFTALHMLERALVPNPPTGSNTGTRIGGGDTLTVPPSIMDTIITYIKQPPTSKSATKVLLALCLAESNRRVAVSRGAAGGVVEALSDLEGTAAERALAALELMCTVPEGAAEVRTHALAVPMLVAAMGKMGGRGREHAISVLAVVFGGGGDDSVEEEMSGSAPAEQVARAVVLAMQGGCCSERGKRKGAQLLKALRVKQENNGGDVDPTIQGKGR